MKIGILGGSFDPVHVGHVEVARSVKDFLGLDRLFVIPAAQHPFKRNGHKASASDRAEMLEIAFGGIGGIEVDRCEIRRGGISYTIDTLRDFKARFPGDELSLIVGADTLEDFESWKEHSEIGALASIVVMTRPNELADGSDNFRVVKVPALDISATGIRAALDSGGAVDELLPPAVLEFIKARRLYSTGV
jgi:nicotinate-nucleotide adenylyltransferase